MRTSVRGTRAALLAVATTLASGPPAARQFASYIDPGAPVHAAAAESADGGVPMPAAT